MPSRYLEEVIKPDQRVNALFNLLGVRPIRLEAERAELELPFKPELLQGAGVLAGGMMAALADEAMAHVVLANLEPGLQTATIEMSVRYFRPVLRSGLRAVAALVNKGKKIISAEAALTDDQGRLVCKASASFFVVDKRQGA
ncbi:PaaI family thioesterase [Fundidesulfovibrio agrisoli]|uniref:PaaI family thioesterase n=1 Tax=Fundidesulfovibrio agrisoli TaxID=2922717 RepID=UPI001FAE2508|nr:PaaI family thioesterase [Fundidesulfovibrio agrisoli]